MSVKERLKKFVEYKGISDRQFSLSIGLSAGYINSISKSIQPDKISRISAQYPELNTNWLITGEGEMLKEDIDFKIKNTTPYDIAVMGGEVYANLLNKLIREKQLAPFALLEQKEQEIKELNREIGRLEERLENSKKTDAQEGGSATCAVAK
jgi:transcriptional regulator with XRE-family HTH domain